MAQGAFDKLEDTQWRILTSCLESTFTCCWFYRMASVLLFPGLAVLSISLLDVFFALCVSRLPASLKRLLVDRRHISHKFPSSYAALRLHLPISAQARIRVRADPAPSSHDQSSSTFHLPPCIYRLPHPSRSSRTQSRLLRGPASRLSARR